MKEVTMTLPGKLANLTYVRQAIDKCVGLVTTSIQEDRVSVIAADTWSDADIFNIVNKCADYRRIRDAEACVA